MGALTVLLGDLVAEREIGVKIVFPVKGGVVLDGALERNCSAESQVDTCGVECLEKSEPRNR